jgi:hypothetical protein
VVRDATAAFAAVGAACAALLAGCGGEEGSAPPPEAQPEGLSARVADCRDWNAASAEVRLATVESIREYAGGPTTGGSGATLEDEEAYDLFEGWCSNDFARRFKLYKLYSRAAAFRSLAP